VIWEVPESVKRKVRKHMAFKVVDATVRPRGRSISSDMEVSYYGKTAQFRLTPAAYRALGSPERLEVLYDAEANQIGLQASTAPHSVTLRKESKEAQGRYFGFRSFANMIGFEKVDTAVIPLTKQGDMLVGNIEDTSDDAPAVSDEDEAEAA
jgi:hypothetical protein